MNNTTSWYGKLVKPTWAPPSYLFGPVWTVLYIIVAISFGTVFYKVFECMPMLHIIEDYSGIKAITKKKDMLSEFTFSGHRALQNAWINTQKYNSVLTDFREQTR